MIIDRILCCCYWKNFAFLHCCYRFRIDLEKIYEFFTNLRSGVAEMPYVYRGGLYVYGKASQGHTRMVHALSRGRIFSLVIRV